MREEVAAIKGSARLNEEQKALTAEQRKAEIAAVIAGREEGAQEAAGGAARCKGRSNECWGTGASETTRMNDGAIEPQQADNPANNP